MMNTLEEISGFLENVLASELSCSPESINVIKRNRNLTNGDFVVHMACLQNPKRHSNTGAGPALQCQNDSSRTSTQSDSNTRTVGVTYQEDLSSIEWAARSIDKAPWVKVDKCTIGKRGNLLFSLSRPAIFKRALKQSSLQQHELDCFRGKVLINCVNATTLTDLSLSVDHLRSIVLSKHVEKLLEINGYKVQTTKVFTSYQNDSIFALLGIQDSEHDQKSQPTINVEELLEKSKYKISGVNASEDNSQPTGNEEYMLALNLKQYIVDNNLPVGKQGFDQNINTTKVSNVHISQLRNIINATSSQISTCLHILPRCLAFSQQNVHLLWWMANNKLQPKQAHLVHGQMDLKSPLLGSGTLGAEEYFSLRKGHVKQSFLLKYGQQVNGAGWDETMSQLTAAVIKIELLYNSHQSAVKLDVSPSSDEVEHTSIHGAGPGIFIMYNYARLATLFQNFKKAVDDGIYPPIPPLDEIQYCCLREEEEWLLLFNYILPYPSMIKESVKEMSLGLMRPNIQTHKVCQFLHSLSCDLSSYYSRVRILTEGRSQLLPVMFARLHLLKALHAVMHQALLLLNVQPLTQL